MMTVDQLNEVQGRYMSLDYKEADTPKGRAVLREFERAKQNVYVSITERGATVICQGMPLLAYDTPLAVAIDVCRDKGGRVDIAWNAGAWINL